MGHVPAAQFHKAPGRVKTAGHDAQQKHYHVLTEELRTASFKPEALSGNADIWCIPLVKAAEEIQNIVSNFKCYLEFRDILTIQSGNRPRSINLPSNRLLSD